MSFGDFHIHTIFSDGSSTPDSYIEAALEEDLLAIGFACHAPLPFDCDWAISPDSLMIYAHEIDRLKKRYANQIQVYKGLEVDFIPGLTDVNRIKKSGIIEPDFTIGSVHFVGSFRDGKAWEITGNPAVFNAGINSIFKGDVSSAITRYYQLVRQMVQEAKPDMIGQLDVIRIQNQVFPYFSEEEKWYRNEVLETLECIRESGALLEVSTRAIYEHNYLSTFPSQWILEQAAEWNIPLVLNSNAHDPSEVTKGFEYATALLMHLGISETWAMVDGAWKAVPLHYKGQIYYGVTG